MAWFKCYASFKKLQKWSSSLSPMLFVYNLTKILIRSYTAAMLTVNFLVWMFSFISCYSISYQSSSLFQSFSIFCSKYCIFFWIFPANIYLFKVNNKNTRKMCETCSKLTIKTPERCQWRRSVVFIVKFEHISHLFLVFLLLIFKK